LRMVYRKRKPRRSAAGSSLGNQHMARAYRPAVSLSVFLRER
jgi:hypothetical protein